MMKFFRQVDIYYIITLLFLFLSANANFISSSDIAWFVILAFFCGVAAYKKLLTPADQKTIITFSIVYLIFVTFRDLFVNGLETRFLISDVLYLFKFVYLSFLYCTILKERTAAYFVRVVTHLTIVSLFFYFFQIVGLGDYIFNFSSALGLHSSMDFPDYTNFLIFTFIKGKHEVRNSGFSWEPGAFGCFLVIALMLNLFLKKFIFERRSYILIAGILTTLATTDYLALLVVLFLAYRYRVQKINVWSIILLLVVGLVVLNLPLLGDKISGTYAEDKDDLKRLKYLEVFYRHRNMQIPLNRFASMFYIIKTFGYQLILGVSNKYDVIVNSKFNINISNGIFDFMAKFGVVGFLYLIYKYIKFCLESLLKVEYMAYCVLTLLFIGFGEPIMFLPVIIMFIFIQTKQLDMVHIDSGKAAKRAKFSETLQSFKQQ